MAVIICSGYSANKEERNISKNKAFENLNITIDEKKIDFDKSENKVEVLENLVKQVIEKFPEEIWGNGYYGVDEEDDVEDMYWYGEKLEIAVWMDKKNNSISSFKFQNGGNKRLKINGIGIGDDREKIEERWEKEKIEVINIKDGYNDLDVSAYNDNCYVICTFENDKVIDITYEYDLTGQNLLEYREKSKEKYEEDYNEEENEKKVTYPTKIHLSKKEKQEYAGVIREYEEKYGKCQEEEVKKISCVKFIDLKGDDTVQLMIWYADINREWLNLGYSFLDYSFDIWDLENEKAVKVGTGDSIHYDGGTEEFSIVEYEGQKYIVSSDREDSCDSGLIYYGYKDGKFGIVWYEGEDYCILDGKKIPGRGFKDENWEDKIEASDNIGLNYGMDFSDELHQVKEILDIEK